MKQQDSDCVCAVSVHGGIKNDGLRSDRDGMEARTVFWLQ